jgi:hypothetical protein
MSRRSIRASAPLLEELRFADDAKLFLGEADPDSVEGTPTHHRLMLVFALKDEHGNDGTLALELPNKISVFEVDPRDAPDQGTGPALYKEWKLSFAIQAVMGNTTAGRSGRSRDVPSDTDDSCSASSHTGRICICGRCSCAFCRATCRCATCRNCNARVPRLAALGANVSDRNGFRIQW